MEAFLLWFKTYEDPIQTLSILVGFFVTFYTLRKDAKLRRLNHWLTFTQQHRDLWKLRLEMPGLNRIHVSTVDLEREPVTEAEHQFVSLLIHHLSAVQKTSSEGMFSVPVGLRTDIRTFFALPVPLAVWQKVKHLHDEEFVQFVESCLDVERTSQ